ncbi:hypothetical protein OPQ81_003497 [Rhizoctonia solani]|nr:hypothetical protein OPQ81_003497 [Rhizoctonia solani]
MSKRSRSGTDWWNSSEEAKRGRTQSTPARGPEQNAGLVSTGESGQPNSDTVDGPIDLTLEGHPELPRRLAGLGALYHNRFEQSDELEDLEKAIEYGTRALNMTLDGHEDLPRQISGIGESYTDRFWRLGQLDDLKKAIKYGSRALELTPDGHPDLPARHASLGASYNSRFQRLGELDDLEKGIEHKSWALSLTPEGHPDLPNRLANLGISYADRFWRLGELDDLENAIEYKSRALELTPDGHPHLSRRHADLGVSYSDRYKGLGNLEDLEKGVEYDSRALELTPNEHPDLPNRYFNRAMAFYRQYGHTGDASHLKSSLELFRKSSHLSTGIPREVFQNALDWARYASEPEHSSLNCIEAYQTTIDLLPQFIWLGATTNQRYQDLSMADNVNLAVNAACAAIRHSEPKLALEWLEHARCVVWNQSLMVQSPIGQLQSSHPDLAARLQAVAKQLYDAGSDAPSSQAHSPGSVTITPEQLGQQRRRLAKEYNNLLAETRTLPGFEDFLRPMKVDGLIGAARSGPIVLINSHTDYCDALLLIPGKNEVTHIPLPNFTGDKAWRCQFEVDISLRYKGIRERGIKFKKKPGHKPVDHFESVLAELWNGVVKPVINALGYTNIVPSDQRPHIMWCPTGALSFLPLHAAGDYTQPGSRVFDYVISSYTPTLTALVASTPSSLSRDSRMLVIGRQATPGCTPLPGIATEIAYVKEHTHNRVNYSQLLGSQAVTTVVLDAMEQHDWVHLACHAHQNVNDATKSGFFLHNGTLDLASINRRSFKNKGLAYLSACQTATGDEGLPDEAIHLASGMLMAGYTSVIGTMWSVHDKDAPLVSNKVYSELTKDGKIGNGEAGRALHKAVAELRDAVGEKEFGRWVPYIHIGS